MDRHSDSMEKLFPKTSKCTLKMFGQGGGINTIDFFCILQNNVIHQYIYFVLWTCFYVLFIADIFTIIRRFSLICVPAYRSYFLWEGGSCKWNTVRQITRELSVRNIFHLYSNIYMYYHFSMQMCFFFFF